MRIRIETLASVSTVDISACAVHSGSWRRGEGAPDRVLTAFRQVGRACSSSSSRPLIAIEAGVAVWTTPSWPRETGRTLRQRRIASEVSQASKPGPQRTTRGQTDLMNQTQHHNAQGVRRSR
ncbi:hypothetical protein AAFF_G00436760 [Aldrovandia affinis]|uniref:Uncharacterized protein n=1 Tax=Aldrovandia affinis TaxID=143900 RepID=A0AAD7WI06_9TELE|nr:hypothetical protein AAFF_G00436760 [Aldrovandia affinis]